MFSSLFISVSFFMVEILNKSYEHSMSELRGSAGGSRTERQRFEARVNPEVFSQSLYPCSVRVGSLILSPSPPHTPSEAGGIRQV